MMLDNGIVITPLFQTLIFPAFNLGACTFSLLMFARVYKNIGYLPKECVLAMPALIIFGVGYTLIMTGVIKDLVALRGVLFFLLLSPGIAVYLRRKDEKAI